MKHIDEEKLETDLPYRFQYLAEFIGINEDDLQTIHLAAGAITPLVPTLVAAVYDQLFRYNCTKRHFVPRQHGYEDEILESIETLTLDHEMIQFREQHLGRYLETLVTKPYDEKMMQYLDTVGKIHTPKAGNQDLNVPLVQMNALMGFVSNALISAILGLNFDRETEVKTLGAFQQIALAAE